MASTIIYFPAPQAVAWARITQKHVSLYEVFIEDSKRASKNDIQCSCLKYLDT